MMLYRCCQRRAEGFTLVESLVAIGILSVLVALAVIAVSASRESARRTACGANIREVNFAVLHYEAANQRFPPGRLFGKFGSGPYSTAWGWPAMILPFLEAQSMYDRGGVLKKRLIDSEIVQEAIPIYLCPSNSYDRSGVREDVGNMGSLIVGITNYKAVMGSNWGEDPSLNLGLKSFGAKWTAKSIDGSFNGLDDGDGCMFRTDSRLERKLEDLVDGASNTYLLGEALPEYDQFCCWPYSNGGYSTCAIPPNIEGVVRSNYANSQSFRSSHAGGLWMAKADGSASFVVESIELAVWQRSASINGGPLVDSP